MQILSLYYILKFNNIELQKNLFFLIFVVIQIDRITNKISTL